MSKHRQYLYRNAEGSLAWHETPPCARRGRPSWPILSDAAGVHPDQVPEAMEKARRDGVPTEFNSLGQAVFNSNVHQRKYLQTIGMHNKKAYY